MSTSLPLEEEVMRLFIAVGKRFVVGLILSFAFVTLSHAHGIEGTWRLVMRQLPDGTVQTPPTVAGLGTLTNGFRHLNVFWQTPDGKPASVGVVSKVKLTSNEYTETLIAFALDDGSGNPVVYNFTGETKTAAVMREGGRISYQLPFDPPSVVYEGDKMTATLEGAFVDYWERVE
jgi:hypothetical protein